MGLVIASFVASKGFKDLKSKGEQFLASLTGCKIKPSGTPDNEITMKLPKLWFAYGSGGTYNSPNFKGTNLTRGAFFDPLSGKLLSLGDIDSVFSLGDRRKVEANARKHCETTTGAYGYYTEIKSPSDDKGVVFLSDGNKYAAQIYGVQGGSLSSPVSLRNVHPLDSSPTGGGGKNDTPKTGSGAALPIAAIAAFLLFRS